MFKLLNLCQQTLSLFFLAVRANIYDELYNEFISAFFNAEIIEHTSSN